MVGVVTKLIKLFNGVTKNPSLNDAIKQSSGVLDLVGKLAQIGIDSIDAK